MAPDHKHDPRFLLGVEHFNRGEYFEAHEAWEDLWLESDPADRRFFQSLIQAAVALHHWGHHNRAGARRLFAAGREKARAYCPAHLGLDVEAFWTQMEAALAGALTDRPEGQDSAVTPVIALVPLD